MVPPRLLSSRLLFSILTILMLLSLGVAHAQVGGSSGGDAGKPANDGVWITIGSDAFDVLQDESFSYAFRPLEAFEERRDVVITRIDRRDVERLSDLMHRRFNRCSGFLRHASLHAAESALAGATNLSNSFASLVGFEIDQAALVADLVAQLDDTQIRSTIEHLSTSYNNRYYSTASGEQSALWIRDTWLGLASGRSDVTVELYNHSGYDQPSVILTIDGTTKASEVVVMGGHLDSTRSGSKTDPNFVAPGADDNASGIAVLTEVLRVAMAEGFVPERTIKLMGYAAEEVGLLGSQDIAADHASQGVNVVAVMQLDMTAYNGSVSDITLVGDYTNADLRGFVGQLIDTYQPGILRDSSNCGYACSDHASWHNEGFPAVIPFEATVGQHNPNIHTTGDTRAAYGNSEDHAMKFARLAAAFLVEAGIDDTGGGGGGGGGQSAVYDASLGAPACATVGDSCDSGSLLDGRGSVGPEPNQPNTLDTCTDGSSGSYHSDESIDAIRVATFGGTDFTPGDTVEIEVDVWAYSNGSADRLDLYYAADATSPSWTYLTTITPPGGGARTLTASYTLPAGGLQAVRGNFRYQGSTSSCSGGSWDDTDDLVFATTDEGGGGGGGGGGSCAVEEDFEGGASGWTTSGNCSTGTFVTATPTQQVSTVVTQPAGDHTPGLGGSGNALFTATNTSAGADDVDGGTCVVTSPVYTVDDASDVSVWFFHGQRDAGDDPADGFELEISTNGGSTWSFLVDQGDIRNVASWTEVTSTVAAGTSVRFRASATDGSGPGDIVEAGLDDVTICPQ